MRFLRSHLVSVAAGLFAALLTVFHLVLLGQRVADGSVSDPAVALEWIVGLVLLLGLVRLYRRAVLFTGRSAQTLWVLVLLLHVVAVVPGEGSLALDVDSELLLAAPLGLLTGIVVLALARDYARASARNRLVRRWRASARSLPGIRSLECSPALIPRAPPA